MKKFSLSFFVIVASAAYVVYQYIGGNAVDAGTLAVQQPAAQTLPISVPVTTPTPTPAPTPTPTPVITPAPKPQGQYADGTYTGSSANAYYGYVQVQAVVQGGKLTTVNFLQYPNDRSTSRYINAQAMPRLQSEAISAQSAQVSGVSGASDTSAAFSESLAAALAQAKN